MNKCSIDVLSLIFKDFDLNALKSVRLINRFLKNYVDEKHNFYDRVWIHADTIYKDKFSGYKGIRKGRFVSYGNWNKVKKIRECALSSIPPNVTHIEFSSNCERLDLSKNTKIVYLDYSKNTILKPIYDNCLSSNLKYLWANYTHLKVLHPTVETFRMDLMLGEKDLNFVFPNLKKLIATNISSHSLPDSLEELSLIGITYNCLHNLWRFPPNLKSITLLGDGKRLKEVLFFKQHPPSLLVNGIPVKEWMSKN